MILAPILVPVGTAIFSALAYLFRFAAVKLLVYAAFFAVISLAGYFAIDLFLPSWLSVENLNSKIEGFSPPIAYGLHLISFYDGFKLFLSALISAWIVKKLPAWVWFGPLYRLFNK